MTKRLWHNPRRRPGAAVYARSRIRALVRPPVTVREAPAALIKRHDVPVTMRDGVVLRGNVYLPPGDGPFPVLLSAHPYGKDNLPQRTRRGWKLNFQFRIMNQPEPFEISSETGWEAPDPVWWVEHGYAVINADLRGAGTSDGTGSLFSAAEAEDIYDLIEWAGHEPFSNGRVGMLGVSYLALSQYRVAALHPPSLAAICPWEGFTDAYRDFMTPGGVEEKGFSVIWQAVSKRAARLTDDLGSERRRHPLRDDWWQALTPDLAAITVPILVCASFSDANLHSSGSFRAFEQVSSPDRFLYTHRGPKWSTFYSADARSAQLAFFERFLHGAAAAPGTGDLLGAAAVDEDRMPTLPRVRLEVRESRTVIADVRDEQEWPLARSEWQSLSLGAGRRLTLAAAAGEGARSSAVSIRAEGGVLPRTLKEADAPGSVSFGLRHGSASFTFVFREGVELTGPMNVRLWVSLVGASDANLFVGVEKWSEGRYTPFEGSYGYGRDRVATGRQRLALRELDPVASAPHRPVHTFARSEPLQPGQIVRVDVPLSESSTRFNAGDALRLVIAGRELDRLNPLFGHFPAHYARSGHGICTLYWGPRMPSALEVPTVTPS